MRSLLGPIAALAFAVLLVTGGRAYSHDLTAILNNLLVSADDGRGSESNQLPEQVVKAAMLYKLAMFTDWPANAFNRPGDPIIIGILGEDPFGDIMETAIAGKNVRGRGFMVKRFKWISDIGKCHILYISSSERNYSNVLSTLNKAPVLTVSDVAGSETSGVMIVLALEGGKVKFRINLDSAEAADIKLSSKLLELAENVVRGGK